MKKIHVVYTKGDDYMENNNKTEEEFITEEENKEVESDKDIELSEEDSQIESLFSKAKNKWQEFGGFLGVVAYVGAVLNTFISNVLFNEREKIELRRAVKGTVADRERKEWQQRREPEKKKEDAEPSKKQENVENKDTKQADKVIDRISKPIPIKEIIEHDKPDMMIEKYIDDTKDLYGKFSIELLNTGCDVTLMKIGEDKVYSVDNEDLLNNNTVAISALFKQAGMESYNEKAVVLSALSDSIINDTMSVSSNIGNKMNIVCEKNVVLVEANGINEKIVLNEEIPNLSKDNISKLLDKLYVLSKEEITYTIGDQNNGIIIKDNGKTTTVDLIRYNHKTEMGEYNFNKGSDIKSFVNECFKQKVKLELDDKWVNYKDLAFAIACVSSGTMSIPDNRDLYSYRQTEVGKPHFVIKQNDLGKQIYSSVPNINGNTKPEFAFSVPSNPTTEEFVHIMEKSAEMRYLISETEPNKDYDVSVENNINDMFNKEYKFDEISIDKFNEIKEESLEEPQEEIQLDENIIKSLADMINSRTIIEEDIDYDDEENDLDEEEFDIGNEDDYVL